MDNIHWQRPVVEIKRLAQFGLLPSDENYDRSPIRSGFARDTVIMVQALKRRIGEKGCARMRKYQTFPVLPSLPLYHPW